MLKDISVSIPDDGEARSGGKRVLDAFSYSGGFGIYAAAAGATEVECVDASEAALALGRRNAELNGLTQLAFVKNDVFHHLDDLVKAGRKFDVVVLDPPKFARNRAAVPEALKGYRRLHQLALKLLAKDGILVSCCCTGLITLNELEDVIAQTAVEGRRDVQVLERRGFTVVPVRHRHRRLFGGGFHCFTLDTVRRGGPEDYLS